MRNISRVNIANIANPYDFANPITDDRLFIGRDDELAEVLYYLKQARETAKPIHIAFIGDRASGKTSFLNITENEARRQQFCTVRIDLDEGDTSTQLAFFRKLYNQIVSEAFRLGAFGGRSGESYQAYLDLIATYRTSRGSEWLPLTLANIIARALDANRQDIAIPDDILRDDLRLISTELHRPIVILFDECDVFRANKVVLEKLRNTFMNMSGYMLVFAGTKHLFPVLDDVFSPIMRQFKQIEIGPYQQLYAAEACIRQPLMYSKLSAAEIKELIPKSAYNEIHVLSGGRPYEIQLICHYLFRQCQTGQAKKFILNVFTIDQIQKGIVGGRDVLDRPVLQAARNLRKRTLEAFSVLGHFESSTDFESCWALEYISHSNVRFSRGQLRAECDNLVNAGILMESPSGLSFAGDDFDRLYIKYTARQKGVVGQLAALSAESVLSNVISDLTHQFREFIFPVFISTTSNEYTVEYLSEFLSIVNKTDTFDVFPFPIEMLLMQALLRDKASNGLLFGVTLDSPIGRLQKFFYWEDQTREANLRRLLARGQEIGERAAEINWKWEMSNKPMALPSRIDALHLLTQFGNERQKDRIASILLRQLPEKYVYNQDLQTANLLADTAFYISGTRQTDDANNVGYLHLAQGNLDEAKAWFDAAEQMESLETDQALLQYNVGAYWLLNHRYEEARLYFQRAMDISINSRTRAGALLVFRRDKESQLQTEETFENILISDACKMALDVLKQDITDGIK